MKKTLISIIASLTYILASAAPAPYPITVNSRAQTAPPITVYRANETVIRASFVDGSDASDITGATPFLNWATNSTAGVVSTSSWAVVGSATNGVVDFSFTPSALNHAAGRYMYEVGVRASNNNVRVYRQGVFTVLSSPTASGVAAVNWTTNVDWNLIGWTNLPDFIESESDPIAQPAASNALFTASASFIAATNAQALAVAAYPRNNPSNFVNRAQATNGMQVAGAYLTEEADTFATVTARGGTTTNEITALRYAGSRFGYNTGNGASGNGWSALGYNTGNGASGNGWSALGYNAGNGASGNGWSALGYYAGSGVSGNFWAALGMSTGTEAIGDGWFATGCYAGRTARGNNRLYIDVYSVDPEYAADGAINDRIFGDSDGKLYLGRGAGAPGGAVGGTLRGPWTGGGFVDALAVTGVVSSAMSGHNADTNTTAHAALFAAKQNAETVVSGATRPVSYGYSYDFTSATNVLLRVGTLPSGRSVNYVNLNNTATNAITATGIATWRYVSGGMTNSIPAGRCMTFGFHSDSASGKTNFYATAASAN